MNNKTLPIWLRIKSLIVFARLNNDPGLADILEHRMDKVSWTSSEELIIELHAVLLKAINNNLDSDTEVTKKIRMIINEIEDYKTFTGKRMPH